MIAPLVAIKFIVIILARTKPMCATDEYAIRDFISFCRLQFNLVDIAPYSLILINQIGIFFKLNNDNEIKRINPYPPNFNNTAAKIIDPSRGASTWAFGNQRWVKNIGIFTINAIINIIVNFNFIHEKNINIILGLLNIKIPTSNGKEAKVV